MINVAKDVNLNEIVINGDLLDFYNVNSHGPKHPDIIDTLESEIADGREFLTQLRATFPKTKIHFIYGNHEDRLDRFIVKNCRAFHSMVKLETQLNLNGLNITWQPYNSYYQLSKNLRVQHSPPSYGVNGARTSLLTKLDMSYIWGCTHRIQHATVTGASGEIYEAFFNGWMGSTTLSDQHERVFSYAKKHENWQQCFSIVDVVGDDHFVNQCLIKNGRVVFEGKIYEVAK